MYNKKWSNLKCIFTLDAQHTLGSVHRGFILGATHVDVSPTIEHLGFTLAEVLITLGIIGVVAAMTIPNLIATHQKKQTVVKLQKAISVLNQAYKLSYDDVGEPSVSEAFNMGASKYFSTYWAPYIKTEIYCDTYAKCRYKSQHPWSLPSGKPSDISVVYGNNRTTFYTADGFLYVIFTAGGPGPTIDKLSADTSVYVDINGAEGPNRYGRDVFVLTRVEKDGGGIQPRGISSSNENINSSCSKTGDGLACAEKIRRAGWKIENDYPWK